MKCKADGGLTGDVTGLGIRDLIEQILPFSSLRVTITITISFSSFNNTYLRGKLKIFDPTYGLRFENASLDGETPSGVRFSTNISHFFCNCLNFNSRFADGISGAILSLCDSYPSLCLVSTLLTVSELASSGFESIFALFTFGSRLITNQQRQRIRCSKNVKPRAVSIG